MEWLFVLLGLLVGWLFEASISEVLLGGLVVWGVSKPFALAG